MLGKGLLSVKGEKMLEKLFLEMIAYYSGDPKRIQHFTKVHSYAKLIGELSGMQGEAGKVYDHEHRSFWTGNTLLLSFYITDPQIPGSADPSYYQGQSARTDECKENRAL